MYPFYVEGKKIFSFTFKPTKNGLVKDDDTGQWYEVTESPSGKGRKVFGKKTVNHDGIHWKSYN